MRNLEREETLMASLTPFLLFFVSTAREGRDRGRLKMMMLAIDCQGSRVSESGQPKWKVHVIGGNNPGNNPPLLVLSTMGNYVLRIFPLFEFSTSYKYSTNMATRAAGKIARVANKSSRPLNSPFANKYWQDVGKVVAIGRNYAYPTSLPSLCVCR